MIYGLAILILGIYSREMLTRIIHKDMSEDVVPWSNVCKNEKLEAIYMSGQQSNG